MNEPLRQQHRSEMNRISFTLLSCICIICLEFVPATAFLARDPFHSHPEFDAIVHLSEVKCSQEDFQTIIRQWATRSSNSTSVKKVNIARRIAEIDMVLVYANTSVAQSNDMSSTKMEQTMTTLRLRNYTDIDTAKAIDKTDVGIIVDLQEDALENRADHAALEASLYHQDSAIAHIGHLLDDTKARVKTKDDQGLIVSAENDWKIAMEATRKVHQLAKESRALIEIADRKMVAARNATRIAQTATNLAERKKNKTFKNAPEIAEEAKHIAELKVRAAESTLTAARLKLFSAHEARRTTDTVIQDTVIATGIAEYAVAIAENVSDISDLDSRTKAASMRLETIRKAVNASDDAVTSIACDISEIGTQIIVLEHALNAGELLRS